MKTNTILPDNILKAMSPADRKSLGKAGMTAKEAQEKYRAGKEKELQRQVAAHLDRHQIYYETDRMDKKTSGKKGRADFRCCVAGLWLSLECKTEAGTLSSAQAFEAARLRKSGGQFVVVFCLQDAISVITDMHAL